MKILGVFSHGQNPAAALIVDGALIAMAEEERFSRFKVSHALQPTGAIEYVLKESGLSMSDIDEIAFGWDAPRYVNEVPKHYGLSWLKSKDWRGMLSRLGSDAQGESGIVEGALNILGCQPDYMRKQLVYGIRALGYFGAMPPVVFYPHHLCHAASTFFCSGFDRASILTLDGHGEITCTELFSGEGSSIRSLQKFTVPNSLGWYYSAITEYLGFRPYSEEGKLMGLAAYGEHDSTFSKHFERMLRLTTEGYELDARMTFMGERTFGRSFADGLVTALGPPRGKRDEITQRHKNIAFAAQHRLEQTFLHLVELTTKRTGYRDVCLAGGVAMNCKANGEVLRSGLCDRLFVQAASSDAGTALGAAMLAAQKHGDDPRFIQNHTYYGPSFGPEEIEPVLQESKLQYTREADICETVAELLHRGALVGWFQGRMEYGARALGNRSIVANPLMKEAHHKVNAQVKHRELWRPFAPSMTQRFCEQWLEPASDTPFMITAAWAKPGWAERLPAVVHVDGSVRPQTVTEQSNPRYHALIRAFGRKSGYEVVLNTSLNDKGEPLVCTPREAIKLFAASGLDAMAIGDFLIRKNHPLPGANSAQA